MQSGTVADIAGRGRQLPGRAPGGRGDGRASARPRSSSASPVSWSRASPPATARSASKPDAPDHRAGAPEADRRRPARGAARGRAGDHLGDRPAERGHPAGPRGGDRRHDRRLRGHQPGRLPGPPRADQRSSTRSRRSSTWARCRRVAAQLDLELLAIVAEPYAVARCLGGRADPAGRRAVHRRRRRHHGHRARAPGRRRGDAHVRARRPGLHEVARRPAGAAVRPRGGDQDRLRAWPPVERPRDVAAIIAEDVAVWSAGVELVLEEFGRNGLLPGRI